MPWRWAFDLVTSVSMLARALARQLEGEAVDALDADAREHRGLGGDLLRQPLVHAPAGARVLALGVLADDHPVDVLRRSRAGWSRRAARAKGARWRTGRSPGRSAGAGPRARCGRARRARRPRRRRWRRRFSASRARRREYRRRFACMLSEPQSKCSKAMWKSSFAARACEDFNASRDDFVADAVAREWTRFDRISWPAMRAIRSDASYLGAILVAALVAATPAADRTSAPPLPVDRTRPGRDARPCSACFRTYLHQSRRDAAGAERRLALVRGRAGTASCASFANDPGDRYRRRRSSTSTSRVDLGRRDGPARHGVPSQFPGDPRVYLSYTNAGRQGVVSRISEFTSGDGRRDARSGDSERDPARRSASPRPTTTAATSRSARTASSTSAWATAAAATTSAPRMVRSAMGST